MHVLPVIDVLDGVVVHAIAGRRDEYRPISSRLTYSHEPLAVANAIRTEFGLNRLYLADLDGILHRRPNENLYRRLIDEGFELLVDPGIREPAQIVLLNDRFCVSQSGASVKPQRSGHPLDPHGDLAGTWGLQIVVGLETCRSPVDLATMANQRPGITFSLDLFSGSPRLHEASCGWATDPDEIARQALHCQVGSLIVLDLADVGMGTGGSTDLLCQAIRAEFPDVWLVAGGGVRGPDDLSRFARFGVDAVLVASALHDGRLHRADVESLAGTP